jgi:LPS O-antigen subunit length determinant protein (WzzB/FepE family)
MTDARQTFDDEIDLVELFATLWEGKWKIFGVASAAIFGSFLFQVVQGPPNFVATTEIRPISSTQVELYGASNAVGFFGVTPESLISRYVEELEERIAIEEATLTAGLISREGFVSEQDFSDAVSAFVSSIEIVLPTDDEIESRINQRFAIIRGEFNDEVKWREMLSLIDEFATTSVQLKLQESFQSSMALAQQERSFLLEDLSLRIENLLSDYNRVTSDRLAYLREQAEIARELDVATNTLEVQTYNAQNSIVAAVNTNIPFYLRGYEAIEKEIQLIESRQDATAFVDGLLAVEQEKRDVLQDRTLERAASLWDLTPAATQGGFSAASMRIAETNFEVKQNRSLVFALAGIIGAFIGIVVVLFSSALRKRKEKAISS